MRVDSHQHFWKASRGDYYWMTPEVPVLCRDYTPEDLKPILKKHRIDKTVLVQAAPTVAETDFLLKIASEQDFVGGVVGWLEFESENFLKQFDSYRRNPKFIGIRPMLQDLPEDDWILRPRVLQCLREIAAQDFPFEILIYARHLPYVLKAVEKTPNLRAVVDHIAKPEIRAGKLEPWSSLMGELAQNSNICCKLSGMITEADEKHWKPDDLKPYVERAVEAFGLSRVLYGSDWPVCLCAGSYDQVIAALSAILSSHLDKTSEAAVFGENAARFYKLK